MRTDKKLILALLLLWAASLPGCFLGKNQKMQKLDRILMSGNQAIEKKRYDEAISIFDSGLADAPGESALLISKSYALRLRGVDRYNASIKLTDEAARRREMEIAKQDFSDSAAVSAEAMSRIKSSRVREYVELVTDDPRRTAAFAMHAEAMRFLANYVDKNKALEALEATHEYTDIETDADRKTKALLDAGKMLLETGNGDKALVEYKNILESNPNHIEALLGAGLALSQTGEGKQFKEAEPYFERFVALAPADHRMKAEIERTLEYMKSNKR